MSIETVSNAPAPLRLRINFSSMLVANLIYAGCQWGMLAVLTKTVSEDVVGIYVLAASVVAPFVVFGEMRLQLVQVGNDGSFRFADFLGFRIVSMVLTITAIAVFSYLQYIPAVASIIVAVGVARALACTTGTMHGDIQKHHRMDRVGMLLTIRGLATLVAMSSVIYLTQNLLWAVAAMAVVSATMLVTVDYRSVAWVRGGSWQGLAPAFDRRRMLRLACTLLPLGISAMIASVNVNLPRYLIESYCGTAALGLFGPLAYVFTGLNMAFQALSTAALPRLAEYSNQGRYKAFQKLQGKMLLIACLMAAALLVGVYLFGRPILRIAYTEKYAAEFPLFMWISLGGALLIVTNMVRSGLFAVQCYRFQLVWDIMLLVILLIACLILIPKYQLMGAAWAVAAGQAVQLATGLIMLAWAARKIKDRS